MPDESQPEAPPTPTPTRRPYATPTLRVFGGVGEITASDSMTGALKDGGPNNLKT